VSGLDQNCSQEKNNKRIAGLGKYAAGSNSAHDKNRADSLDDSIQLCLLHNGKRISSWWAINSTKLSLWLFWSQNNTKAAKNGQSDNFVEFITHQLFILYPLCKRQSCIESSRLSAWFLSWAEFEPVAYLPNPAILLLFFSWLQFWSNPLTLWGWNV